jgi:hypothetical protein
MDACDEGDSDGAVCRIEAQCRKFRANYAEVPDGSEAGRLSSDPDLFRTELINLLVPRHELVKLAALIDWQVRIPGHPGHRFQVMPDSRSG